MITNFASVIFRAMPLANIPISASAFSIVGEWQDIWELKSRQRRGGMGGGGSYAALSRISHQNVSSPPPHRLHESESCAHKEADTWWVGYTYSLACNTPLPSLFPFPPLPTHRREKGLDCVKKQRAASRATRPPGRFVC